MYREDTSTLNHSLNFNDPHMQMSYKYELVSFQVDKTGPGIGSVSRVYWDGSDYKKCNKMASFYFRLVVPFVLGAGQAYARSATSALTIKTPNYSIGIFTHSNLCLADAIHNFGWMKINQI